MKTFKVGDVVQCKRKLGTMLYLHEDTDYVVISVKDVPENLIDFDPLTQEGGVGHHQWVTILNKDDQPVRYSGWFFDETIS